MNLKTKYLGLELKNPIVPSSSPLSTEISNIKKMEDAGASAVVLYSLFEEQLEKEQEIINDAINQASEVSPEAINFFPETVDFKTGPEEYLKHIEEAKKAVDIPIIASLNGYSMGGWTDFAKQMQDAGADALELNIYMLATELSKASQDIEQVYVDIVKAVKSNVSIPVSVKLSPFFSSISYMCDQISKAGADGLVLFNRFYQPDIDLENLKVTPNVLFSTPFAARLPLRWIGILYKRVKADLAATSGIHSAEDVVKMIMAGASTTQMFSALMKNGIDHIKDVLSKLELWMEQNEYESLDQMKGSMSYMNVSEPSQFERANYMKVLHSVK